MNIKDYIIGVPNFPRNGVFFYDISTLLIHPDAWQVAMGRLAKAVGGYCPDVLAGIESRGFLVAAPLALKLGCGVAMIRKQGKLPGPTICHKNSLEYGFNVLEIQENIISSGQRVVVIDDLLATGGTVNSAIHLLRNARAKVVAAACIIELSFLHGRSKLDVPFTVLVTYHRQRPPD